MEIQPIEGVPGDLCHPSLHSSGSPVRDTDVEVHRTLVRPSSRHGGPHLASITRIKPARPSRRERFIGAFARWLELLGQNLEEYPELHDF